MYFETICFQVSNTKEKEILKQIQEFCIGWQLRFLRMFGWLYYSNKSSGEPSYILCVVKRVQHFERYIQSPLDTLILNFHSVLFFPDNFFGNKSKNLQQFADKVLPAKYVNGYTPDEANQELYEKVKREAGYQGKTAQIPKEIDD